MSNLAFSPILTPREMVLKGIFGGAYFGPNAGPTMTKELADFLKVDFLVQPELQLYKLWARK